MKVLIPLAGRGSRFKEAGYEQVKPLIPIIKVPMIRWALKNLKAAPEDMVFYILQQHIDAARLDEKLKSLFSEKITIVPVDKVTEGAPMTLLLGKEHFDNDDEVIVWNGDQFFDEDMLEMIKGLPADCAGMIPVFNSNLTRFSYVKTDENMDILETAEKVPISNFATVGVYYFRKGKDFIWAIDEMVRKDIRRGNEFFVCPTYNELIARGDKIRAVKIENAWPLGTPEDVEHFEKFYRGQQP